MKKGLIIVIAIVAVIAILGGSLVSSYNGLVDKQANVENADAQIQVQLQRRADLIPNLVNTVKAYAAHEEDVYTALGFKPDNIDNIDISTKSVNNLLDGSIAI